MDELRLALRRLAKRPASTLASFATLACVIGAALRVARVDLAQVLRLD